MTKQNELPPEGSFARLQHEKGPAKKTSGETPPQPQPNKTARPVERSPDRSTSNFTIVVPHRRVVVRRTFGVFQDQADALYTLQSAIADSGDDPPGIGQMVQEAIDSYVGRRVKQLPNVDISTEE